VGTVITPKVKVRQTADNRRRNDNPVTIKRLDGTVVAVVPASHFAPKRPPAGVVAQQPAEPAGQIGVLRG
jgi:hypothetical protein